MPPRDTARNAPDQPERSRTNVRFVSLKDEGRSDATAPLMKVKARVGEGPDRVVRPIKLGASLPAGMARTVVSERDPFTSWS